MVIVHGIHAEEGGRVFLFHLLEFVGLALNRPDVVIGRFGNFRHAGDKHGAAICLNAYRRTVFAMHAHIAEQSRVLGIAHHQVANRAALEFDDRHSGVLNFNIGVIVIFPDTIYLVYLAHVPQQQVNLMGGLRRHNAAALAFPSAAPGVGIVIGLVAPAVHINGADNGLAEFSLVDGLTDAHARPVEAALRDHADLHAVVFSGVDNLIAVFQRHRQGLFHQHVAFQIRRLHSQRRMERMGHADRYQLYAAFSDHLLYIIVSADAETLGKRLGPLNVIVAAGNEIRMRQSRICKRVEVCYLAAAYKRGSDFSRFHIQLPP